MAMHGKKYREAKEKIASDKKFSLVEGLAKIKELAHAKFDESVDAHVNIGIDPSKGEQAVRGSVLLPFGTGKKVRIIVFAKGDYAEQARKAGADFVGTDDLVEKITGGWLDFEFAVATPDVMGMVGKLAKILGPKGLLPNKKVGTVTFDVADIVQDLKKGRVFFKNDKNAIVHFSFGKKSFDVKHLQENINAFLKALAASKPSTSKGRFIKKVTITSTMGPAVNLDEIKL
jgi:large subunit ribosomal protein L1